MALGYFAFTVFQGAAVYYLTVGELTDRGASEKVVRVNGSLVPGSFSRAAGGTMASFRLTDGRHELAAAYDGAVPDLFFNENSQIVLEGKYKPEGVFHTETVLVKCPSKYESIAKEQNT